MGKTLQRVVMFLFGMSIIVANPINAIAISLDRDDFIQEQNKNSKTYTTAVGMDDDMEEQSEVIEEETTSEIIDEELSEETTVYVKEETTEANEETEEIVALGNRTLEPHEIIVDSYKDFRALVLKKGDTGNGIVTTYYMGDDFTVTAGMSVPAGYSFILDGTNPETGVRHSYSEAIKSSYSRQDSVGVGAGTAETIIEYKNMDIFGYNRYGVMNMLYVTNTQIFNNVTYTGPTMAINNVGKTIYRDSDVYNDHSYASSVLFKGKDLVFEGTTKLTDKDGRNSYAFDLAGGVLTFAENSNVIANTSNRFANVTSVKMLPGSNLDLNLVQSIAVPATITRIIDSTTFTATDASMTVTTSGYTAYMTAVIWGDNILLDNVDFNFELEIVNSVFRAQKTVEILNGSMINVNSNIIATGIVYNDVSTSTKSIIEDTEIVADVDSVLGILFNFKTDAIITRSTIDVTTREMNFNIINATKSIKITDNSKVLVNAEITRANFFEAIDEFIVEDSDLQVLLTDQIGTAGSYVVVKAKTVKFDNSRVSFDIRDLEFRNVFDVATAFTYIDSDGHDAYFNVQMKNFMQFFKSLTPTITITAQQINIWERKPEIAHVPSTTQMPTARMVREDYAEATAVFKVNKDGIATFSTNEFDGESTKDLGFNKMTVFSTGSISLDVNNQEGIELLVGETNRDTAVKFQYNDTLVEESFSNENGRIHMPLDPPTKASLQKVEVFSNFLYRYDMADFRMFGKLELTEYPKELQFNDLKLVQGPTVYPRKEKMRLVIEDSRPEKTAWKLEAKLKTPLSDLDTNKPSIPDALVFKSSPTAKSNILGTSPIEIYSVDVDHDDVIVLEFDVDEGILLELLTANGVYRDTNYTAEIEWILSEY